MLLRDENRPYIKSLVHKIDYTVYYTRLKSRRRALRYSQSEVSEKLRISRSSISCMERKVIKHVSYDDMMMFAKFYQCTPEYLFGFTNDSSEYLEPWKLYMLDHLTIEKLQSITAKDIKNMNQEEILEKINGCEDPEFEEQLFKCRTLTDKTKIATIKRFLRLALAT